MKHYFYILFAVIVFAASAMAEEVEIQTKDGKKHNGELRAKTDSTLTIYNRYTLRVYNFYADEIIEARTEQGNLFTVENGKIIGHSYEELLARKKAEEKIRMGNPNYAIGKALKSAGSVSLALGVPSMFVGCVLIAAGYSKPNQLKQMTKEKAAGRPVDNTKYMKLVTEVSENSETYSNCATAGVVLLPFGGALTVVGIPLYVHGKNILELAVQVSDNGAGVAVKF